jgi:hypothetical protein
MDFEVKSSFDAIYQICLSCSIVDDLSDILMNDIFSFFCRMFSQHAETSIILMTAKSTTLEKTPATLRKMISAKVTHTLVGIWVVSMLPDTPTQLQIRTEPLFFSKM